MRILIYSAPYYADSDFPLIKALRSLGHEVHYMIRVAPYMTKATLLDFEPQDQRNQVLPASEFKALVPWGNYLDLTRSYVSNCTSGKIGIRSFRLLLKEVRAIKALAPDVICNIDLPYDLHYPLFLVWKKRCTVVVHDPFPHSGESSFRGSIKRRIVPFCCKNFVLLNSRQKNDFCQKYHVSPERVFVSSLGPYDYYRDFVPKTGFSQGGRFIFFWGRLSPYKGIDNAIKAFSLIRDKFPDLHFVIGGAGEPCFDLAIVEADNRIDFIHRYLRTEEIVRYASQCQFVVCPYTDATQSGVIQAAFAMGAPVVATDVGNFSEVITDGITGLLVPPRDPVALAGAFERMLAEPGTVSTMKNNVKQAYGNSSLVWQNIAKKYLEAFEA